MFACKVEAKDIRDFMNKLLREDLFDAFEVRGVELWSFTRFSITGALDPEFLGQDEPPRRFCSWGELKGYVYGVIKGGKRPKLLRVTLSWPDSRLAEIHSNASACFFNIAYDGQEAMCTAGVSEKQFLMDKSVAAAWDDYIERFLRGNNIVISTQFD